MIDDPNTHEALIGEEEAVVGWNRSHLIFHALWVTTLLPVGLPEPSETWGVATPIGVVAHPGVTELSGLAVSTVQPEYIWAHNDSGDAARLYLLRTSGEVMGWIKLNIDSAYDWEDVAIGPCEAGASRSCIYVGDIGDNHHVREKAWVWRIAEPAPEEVLERGTMHVNPEHVWVFDHEGGAFDAEGLFVDPKTARPYVVQKSRRRRATRILELPQASVGRKTWGGERVAGELDLSKEHTRSGRLATGADMVRGERACIGIRTYAHMWTTCSQDPDADVRELMEGEWERTHVGAMFQSEAMAFEDGGRSVLVSSEGRFAPIVRVPASADVR